VTVDLSLETVNRSILNGYPTWSLFRLMESPLPLKSLVGSRFFIPMIKPYFFRWVMASSRMRIPSWEALMDWAKDSRAIWGL